MADYKIELYRINVTSNTFTFLDTIETYKELTFTSILNQIGECSFSLAIQNPKCKVDNLTPLRTVIAIKRNGTIVFVGVIASLESEYRDVAGRVRIQAYSYLYTLSKRYTPQLTQFTSTEQTSIYWSLINSSQSLANGGLGIVNNATSTGVNRDATFEYKQISEALIQQANNINAFDFTFDPVVDANGRLTSIQFNTYYPFKGTNKLNPSLKIGGNVQNFGFAINDDFANTFTLLGAGTGTTILTSTASNSGLQQSYTRVEDIRKYSDISVATTLVSLANALILEQSVPKTLIRIELNPSRKPYFFTNFDLGDTVLIDVTVPNSDWAFKGQARITGYTVTIDDNEKETIVPRFEFFS